MFLNSEQYPYEAENVNFKQNKFSLLYGAYSDFQISYCYLDVQPMFDVDFFKSKSPLFIVDCAH